MSPEYTHKALGLSLLDTGRPARDQPIIDNITLRLNNSFILNMSCEAAKTT